MDAVQLFDTWAMVLSPRDYREFVLPHMQRIMAGLKDERVPTIHFSLGTSTLLEAMEQIGTDVLSLDWKIDIGEARERLGPDRAVQGNLDPFALFQDAERLASLSISHGAGSVMPSSASTAALRFASAKYTGFSTWTVTSSSLG